MRTASQTLADVLLVVCACSAITIWPPGASPQEAKKSAAVEVADRLHHEAASPFASTPAAQRAMAQWLSRWSETLGSAVSGADVAVDWRAVSAQPEGATHVAAWMAALAEAQDMACFSAERRGRPTCEDWWARRGSVPEVVGTSRMPPDHPSTVALMPQTFSAIFQQWVDKLYGL